MKVLKSEVVNTIVKTLIPEFILKEEPIIAGGFARFLFDMISSKRNTSRILIDLSILRKMLLLEKNKDKVPGAVSDVYRFIGVGVNSASDFSDVDIWFLKDNEIWNEAHVLHDLVDLNGKGKTVPPSMLDGTLSYRSDWANSYCFRNTSRSSTLGKSFQFIAGKSDYCDYSELKNVKQLLQSFDIANSQVAWKDGTLYMTDDFFKAESAMEIRIVTSTWNSLSLEQKMHTIIRSLKYSKRTGFCLDSRSFDMAFDVYQEVISDKRFIKHFKKPAGGVMGFIKGMLSPLSPSPSTAQISYYTHFSKKKIKKSFIDIAKSLISAEFFMIFVSQKYFDKAICLPFFFGCECENLNNMVMIFMDNN